MKKISALFNIFLVLIIMCFLFVKPNRVNISSVAITRGITTGVAYRRSTIVDSTFLNSGRRLDEAVGCLKKDMFYQATGARVVSDVLETQVGTMSAYGLDCAGCSGVVGSGYPALENNLMYYDQTYGSLRIVAGDKRYPYGTVVRVVDSKIGTFNVIVLDRGGDIGIGRKYLFDLLFTTEAEASNFGLSRNTTFEVLRYGY